MQRCDEPPGYSSGSPSRRVLVWGQASCSQSSCEVVWGLPSAASLPPFRWELPCLPELLPCMGRSVCPAAAAVHGDEPVHEVWCWQYPAEAEHKAKGHCSNRCSLCDQQRSTTAIKCRWSSYPVVPNSGILESLYILDMLGEAIRAIDSVVIIFILNDLKEVFHGHRSSCESSRAF